MKGYSKIILRFWVLAFLFTSCKHQKEADIPGYLDHLEKHWTDLSDSRVLNHIEYQARFLPNDYRILDRFGEGIEAEQLNKERLNLSDFQYFQLRIKLEEGNIMDYELNPGETPDSRLNYFMHHFNCNLSLIDDGDTIHCEAHQFIPNHSITPWVSVLAAFRATANKTNKRIVIEDEIFHNGKVILKIPASAISNIPQLTLSKS